MAYNVPSYDVNNLSFGPGILYLVGITGAGVSGITEGMLADVGAVNSGSSFQVQRTRLDVFQGNPKSLIDTFVTEEMATLSVTGIEWNLENLALALGAGVVATSGVTTTFGFGGDLRVSDVAAKFVHQTPYGTTITIRIWRAEGQGDLNVSFGDNIHEVPYTFKALETSTKWGGATLPQKERLFQMQLVTA